MIDPGPDLPEHLDALEQAIGGRAVAAIMCTHTHRDHSPAARPLAERTGAPIIGCAPLALETVGPRADASFDGDYAPDRVLADGEAMHDRRRTGDGRRDARPHLQPSLLRISRRVVQRRPCDGLVDDGRRAARRRHGGLHGKPRQAAAARRPRLLSGARARRDQPAAICAAPGRPSDAAREADPETRRASGPRRFPTSSPRLIPGLDPRLTVAAGGSVLAHLLDLERRGAGRRVEGMHGQPSEQAAR